MVRSIVMSRTPILCAAICLAGAALSAYGQTTVPKEKVPADIPDELRESIEELYSQKPEERVAAIESLAVLGEKAAPAIPFLVGLLKDQAWTPNPSGPGRTTSARKAAEALGKIGDQAVPALASVLGNVKLGGVERKNAALALGGIRHPRAREALISALEDPIAQVRSSSAWALKLMRDPGAVEALCRALKDKDRFARRNAAMALGEIGDRRALDSLIGVLSDKMNNLGNEAAIALGKIGDPRAAGALIAAINEDPTRDYQNKAFRALDRIREKNFDVFYPTARLIDVSTLEVSRDRVHQMAVTITEGQALCFKVRERADPGFHADAYIEPRSNEPDTIDFMLNYDFLRPLGPDMLYSQYKGKARRFQAVRAGRETVDIYYHGGLLAERPSVTVEVTIEPLTGEAAEAKALELAADRARIAGLAEAEPGGQSFPENVRLLRWISSRGYCPVRRQIARETLRSMGPKIAAWLKANRGTYNAHLLLACGEAGIAECVPVLKSYLSASEGLSPEILRCAMQSLGTMQGKAVIPLVVPFLSSEKHLLRSSAGGVLRKVTHEDYRKEAAKYHPDWRRWWRERGKVIYGLKEPEN